MPSKYRVPINERRERFNGRNSLLDEILIRARNSESYSECMTDKLKALVMQRGDATSSECFVCGRDNPHGLGIPFVPEGENGSSARYTARAEHAGWPGVLHGGVTFSLMDESLGWALFHRGLRGVTAKTETKFRRPIMTGTQLFIKGWIVDRKRNLITARAEVRTDDEQSELLAETDATMFLLAE